MDLTAHRGLDWSLHKAYRRKPSVSQLESSLNRLSFHQQTFTTIMCIQSTAHVYHRDTLVQIGEHAGNFITDRILDFACDGDQHLSLRCRPMLLAGKRDLDHRLLFMFSSVGAHTRTPFKKKCLHFRTLGNGQRPTRTHTP